ncbi:unnamed protein product [Prunus armeniaca]
MDEDKLPLKVANYLAHGTWDLHKLKEDLPLEMVAYIICVPTGNKKIFYPGFVFPPNPSHIILLAIVDWQHANIDLAQTDHIAAGGVLRSSSGMWVKGFAANIGYDQVLDTELWGICKKDISKCFLMGKTLREMHINRRLPPRSETHNTAKQKFTHQSYSYKDQILRRRTSISCVANLFQHHPICASTMSDSVNHNSIRTLTGSNYKKWREDVEIALGLLDYEMVLTDEALSVPANDASAETKAKYAKWIKANKVAILIMRRSISEEVRGSIIETESAKLFMETIAENFQGSKKAEIGTLMSHLTDMKYNGEGCIRTHILNMVEIGNKLKALKVNVDETMMVHFAINSLPSIYRQLKTTYIAHKEIWSVADLIGICVQEEQSIRKDKGKEQVYLVQDTKFKPKEWTKNKNTDK